MKWYNGVCGGRYKKKCLFNSSMLELSLLKCDVGENIGKHIDPPTKGKQYKIQVNITKPLLGGEFICDKYILNLPFIKIYRADEVAHGVKLVLSGKRIDLIIGLNL